MSDAARRTALRDCLLDEVLPRLSDAVVDRHLAALWTWQRFEGLRRAPDDAEAAIHAAILAEMRFWPEVPAGIWPRLEAALRESWRARRELQEGRPA